jgi:ATP-binding protein involved in chromosome partitioning
MFFKKKPATSEPTSVNSPASSAQASSPNTANEPLAPQADEPALDPVSLKARVVGLECSLTVQTKQLLGDMGWEGRVAQVQVSAAESSAPNEPQGSQVRIEFFADGLSLDAKASIEDFLVKEMRQRYPMVARWVVFMRRKEAPAGDAANARSGASAPRAAEQRPQSGAKGSPAATGGTKLAGTRKPIEGVLTILAVASGKGGVGKSTVSVNLAVALSNQGYKVGILDADIYGPSVPMMLGIEAQPSVNDRNKIVPPEAFGLKVMSFGFFAGEDAAVIWRGPMIMKALQQFFYDVDWGDLDYLVIDLPPGTGDAQLTLVQSLPVDGAVIVTTPQNIALLDAVKAIAMFRKTEVPVLGVVENMATFHCPSCGHETAIFGTGGAERVSQKFDVPVLGQIPLNGSIRAAGDDGKPLAAESGHPVRVRFAEIASRVTKALLKGEAPLVGSSQPKISPLVAARSGDAQG